MAKSYGGIRSSLRERKGGKQTKGQNLALLSRITPKTNKEQFRKMQASARESFIEPANPKISSKGSYTGRLRFGKNEFRALISHCFTGEEIVAAKKVGSYLGQLKDGRYEPIAMSRTNYQRKMKEGAIHFVSYNITINRSMYELKTMAVKKKGNFYVEELPYSIRKKKGSK